MEIIHTLMRFLVIHNAAALAMSIFRNNDFYLPGAVLLVAMLLFTFFRCKVKNGSLFVILHLAVFSVSFMFGGMRCAFLFFTVGGDAILSMMKRFKSAEIKSYSGLVSLMFALSFIIGSILGSPQYLLCCVTEAVIFTGLKFILDGMLNTEEFIAVNEKIADMPVNLIRKRINVFLVIFVAVAALTMIVGINSGLGEILEDIVTWFLGLFEGIFRRETPIEESTADFSVFSEKVLPDMSGMNIKTGRALTPLAKAIGRIMLFVALLIFAVYALKSVIVKLRDVVEGLYASDDDKDESEFIAPKDNAQSIWQRRRVKNSKFDDSLPNDAKIRKLYKKYVSRLGKKEPEKYHTPYEISRSFGACSADDDRITELYEKAKYRKDECTAEEVTELKAVLKKIKK